MTTPTGWPEGLTREAAVLAHRERTRAEQGQAPAFSLLDGGSRADAEEAAFAAMIAEEARAANTSIDAPTSVRDDAEAQDFRELYGYPIDAKRLPAGIYELTGLDAWNQEDPTRPDGVTLRRRGDKLTLTEHEASRLLFIGAIRDPDHADPVAVERNDLLGQANKASDDMRRQIEKYRQQSVERLDLNAGLRRDLRKQADEIKARLAALDESDTHAKRIAAASDEQVADVIGAVFANAFRSLQATAESLRGIGQQGTGTPGR